MDKIEIGDVIFIRSNTRDDFVGRLVFQGGPFTVTLDQCSWIADSGRFGKFMREGKSDGMETEFIGDGCTINFSLRKPWPHTLPTKDSHT